MAKYINLEELMKFPIRHNHYDKEHGSKDFIYGIETVLEYAENLQTIDTMQEWISVDDRLPEKDGGYLVVINYFGNHQSINVRSFAKAGETINKYDLAGEKMYGTATIANMDMFQLTLSPTGCHYLNRRKENANG